MLLTFNFYENQAVIALFSVLSRHVFNKVKQERLSSKGHFDV